jgi:ribosomal subunit interface protein
MKWGELMKINDDFNVAITSRHEELEEDVKNKITEQIQKLSKFHTHIIKATVTIDRQNTIYKSEISIHVPGSIIMSSGEDFTFKKSYDSAYDKMETQIKKLRDKVTEHRPPIVELPENEV